MERSDMVRPLYAGGTIGQLLISAIERHAERPAIADDKIHYSYREFGDAIARVNDSSYGLQAGLFIGDLKSVFQAYAALEVGGVIWNDVPTYRGDAMPYGGVKDSGLGREGVRYAIEEMTEQKVLVLRQSD